MFHLHLHLALLYPQYVPVRSLGCELFRLAMGVHSRKPSSGVLNIPYDSAVLLIKSHGRTAKAFVGKSSFDATSPQTSNSYT